MPAVRADFAIDPCACSPTYTVARSTAPSACRVRAATTAIRLEREPPVVRSPWDPAGISKRSHIQRSTLSSSATQAGAGPARPV
jgi:hypothetical protein